MIASVEGSLSTKFTVQNNLFGGTLMALSTDQHADFLKKVDNLDVMGCFCFTELGYGNNAPKMETTAVFDEEGDQFIIDCPTTMSQKYWITNGACHANYAIVFAQTIVKGKNEGVNAFIVQIREKSMNQVSKMEQMKPCAGVYIEDMGHKMGVNGVDNARLIFRNVKVPRWAMLNKLAQVTRDGQYICDIKKPSNRFFKVADRLLSGRLCIASMSVANAKISISTTIKYSQQRLAVGPTGESDTPIMSYQLQQNSLLPLLARTIVMNFGHNAAKQLFARIGKPEGQGEEHKIIKTLCAVKAMVGWQAEINSRTGRERTGGAGYLAENGLGGMISASHSAVTAEGDNKVLMQKVVKDILTDFRKKRHDHFRFSDAEIQ